jgi:hypothetical protein
MEIQKMVRETDPPGTEEKAAGNGEKNTEQPLARVHWDDSQMQTTFANVINVLNTREEFTLLFGTNQTWHSNPARELTVKLSNRVVLTAFAAKRLSVLLGARVQEYEQRFGKLPLEG